MVPRSGTPRTTSKRCAGLRAVRWRSRAHAPQPSGHSLNAGPRWCWLMAPPRQGRPARVAPRHAECRLGKMAAFRAPGFPGCSVAALSLRSPDNPRGIIVSRALWLAGTRACRRRARQGRSPFTRLATKKSVGQPRARQADFIVFRPASSLRRALDIKSLCHPVSVALFLWLSSRPRTNSRKPSCRRTCGFLVAAGKSAATPAASFMLASGQAVRRDRRSFRRSRHPACTRSARIARADRPGLRRAGLIGRRRTARPGPPRASIRKGEGFIQCAFLCCSGAAKAALRAGMGRDTSPLEGCCVVTLVTVR
jgi:hypothetical protein